MKTSACGSPATGSRFSFILKKPAEKNKGSRCSFCPEPTFVYVTGDRDAPTGNGSVVSAEIIADVMISVGPARALARRLHPPMPTVAEQRPLLAESGNHNLLMRNGRKCGSFKLHLF